jgi:hypothetical protein
MDNEYDDEAVLNRYIRIHYWHFFSYFEKQVTNTVISRSKAVAYSNPNNSDDALEQFYLNPNNLQNLTKLNLEQLKIFGDIGNPLIDAALENGTEAFFDKVCKKILSEYRDEIFINRCEKCQRIVRTPIARMCVWCGHSWFNQPKRTL